jgi:hypothetical protein
MKNTLSALFKKSWLLPCLLLGACQSPQPKPDHLPFHSLYQEIPEEAAQEFLRAGIAFLGREYPPLEFPVYSVHLRHSRKNERGEAYQLAEGFSRTEIVDAQTGVFAIYLSVRPEHPEFYPLLAHEIGHLKQPSRIDDWAMEGFCMVFSEQLCRERGKDWSLWAQRFARDPKDPYAEAYRRALREHGSAHVDETELVPPHIRFIP